MLQKGTTMARQKDGFIGERSVVLPPMVVEIAEKDKLVSSLFVTDIGYSQSHFSSLFKNRTGESPIAYFIRLKVEYACKLLKETDLKINQICFKIGIEDSFYFSRLFSKAMGMSPTEYRLGNVLVK